MTHYIIEKVKIVNVEDGSIKRGAIEIKDGFVEKVHESEIDTPLEVRKINGAGAYAIPGLIDMHCHIKEGTAPLFVASGVTTVRNTAGNVLFLEDLIKAEGDAPTPRIYTADRMIDGPPGLWGPNSFGNFVTEDPEAARREVRRQAEAGANFIKLYGWVSREVLEAVVEEAEKFNLEVSSDLLHSEEVNAIEAAELGVTWFEHAAGFAQAVYPNWHMKAPEEVWEEIDWENPEEARIARICEQMIEQGAKICPTIVTFDQIDLLPNYWNPNNSVTSFFTKETSFGALWSDLEKHEEALKSQLGFYTTFIKKLARTYHELGGTVVAGTDSPAGVWTYFGMALHRELEIFAEIGFSNLEALQAATIRAAESIGLEKVGSLKESNYADIVLLQDNPLEDISNTQKINCVIKGGRIYNREELMEAIMTEEEERKRLEAFDKRFTEIVGEGN